jgi:hypothetical protein
MTTMRMLLSTAALAAVAALFAGGANAMMLDDGTAGGAPHDQALVGGEFVHAALANQTKIDRAVAAANEAYDTYRDTTAIAARQALFAGQQPSVGLAGDSALTRSSAPQALPTASSSSDGVDWTSFGLGAGMTALLAAGIACVVLTTRRRGGIALP